MTKRNMKRITHIHFQMYTVTVLQCIWWQDMKWTGWRMERVIFFTNKTLKPQNLCILLPKYLSIVRKKFNSINHEK